MIPHFAHQTISLALLAKTPISFDASDPGTGKTRVAIEAFATRRLHGSGCALVLAPKSLLRSAWADDFLRFAPHLTVSVATATNREKAFAENADVYVTNIDATTWLVKQPAAFWKRFKDGMIVVDESSHYKHHTSQRSRALNKIKKHFKFRHAMTGTPNSNSITDLWNQVYFLDDGKRLGESFYQFRNSVCDPQQVGPVASMVKWTDKPGIQAVIGKLIEDITIRHKFEECFDIPENHIYGVNYHLSAQQLQVYRDMEDNAVADLADGSTVNAVNGAAVMTKLLQIASGAVYDGQGTYKLIDTARYELIADLVQQRAHSIVFFLWQHQRDQLVEEFQKRGITFALIDGSTTLKEREEAVRHFQSGFFKVMLAHPQSAAHGLTLTKGTSTIWASPTYNLEHFLQGNRRIYRAGQTQKTETIVVTAPHTIEEHVAVKLQDKDAKQNDLLQILQFTKRAARRLGIGKPAAVR